MKKAKVGSQDDRERMLTWPIKSYPSCVNLVHPDGNSLVKGGEGTNPLPKSGRGRVVLPPIK